MSSDGPTGGSLADRITKSDQPASGRSWADEVNSPLEAKSSSDLKQDESGDGPGIPQTDGAAAPLGGSNLLESNYEVEVKFAQKLKDMQADPDNPLYSAKTFEELNLKEEILKGVIGMNFRKPSKVQEKTLPLLLMNPPTNLIGQSQSGTGKTAAFVLNILSRLDLSSDQARKTPQALVLAPARELARQIVGVVQLMGKFMDGLKVAAAVPTEMAQRNQKIEAAVVVGTPGTVMTTITKRLLDPRGLKVLVIDEADNMLDQQGMADQCIRVKRLLPKTVQIVLFSATFPDNVVKYAEEFAPGANQMTLRHEDLTVEGIKQIYLDCNSDNDKYEALIKFYGLLTIGSSMIFVKTRETADQIVKRMTAEGHKVALLTADLDGPQRDATIDAFRTGQAKVLIATNVLARGIDVRSVSMVVNYDVPDRLEGYVDGKKNFVADPQTYYHRIGRTGRFGKNGVAVTFISNRKDWEMLMAIQAFYGSEMTKVDIGDDWSDVEEKVQAIIKSSQAAAS